jgi:hypothetical protein
LVNALSGPERDASQEDFDSSQQFGRLKGLGNVVVSAQLQANDFIYGISPCGEEKNWCAYPSLPKIATDIEPTLEGQHDIEDDYIEREPCSLVEGIFSVCSSFDDKALSLESVPECNPDILFIFDNQDGLIHSLFPFPIEFV